jgi:predicted transcriptional regulator
MEGRVRMDYLSPIRSELKQKIIINLLEGEKKISELKSGIDGKETSILHVLKEFEKLNLTTKTSGTYSLTSLGIIEAQIFQDVVSTAKVIEKFKEFWLNHNVQPIPPQLISRLGALKESVMVHSEKTQLGQVYVNFMQILLTSKKVAGISPIFHPDYVPIIENLLDQGNNVDLILTTEVLNKTLSTAHLDELKKNFANGTLKIFLNEDLRLALTVTDKNFSLGLFTLDGDYDDNTDLISTNPEAIKWGEELFQIKLKESTRIGPEALG